MIGCRCCQQIIKESSPKEFRVLYQENLYANVYIGKALNRPALIVERGKCPKYAECGFKDVGVTSAFLINYCPNCGAKLVRPSDPDRDEFIAPSIIAEGEDNAKIH